MITSYATALSSAAQARRSAAATKPANFLRVGTKTPAEKALERALAAAIDMDDLLEARNLKAAGGQQSLFGDISPGRSYAEGIPTNSPPAGRANGVVE